MNKGLVWSGKGKKPGWLRELELSGKEAVEIAV
jgi:DNA-binding protein H-NS